MEDREAGGVGRYFVWHERERSFVLNEKYSSASNFHLSDKFDDDLRSKGVSYTHMDKTLVYHPQANILKPLASVKICCFEGEDEEHGRSRSWL